MRTAIFVFLLATIGSVHADDSIRITFETGECIGCSAEKSEIYISRPIGPGPTVVELDKFFGLIRSSLQDADMPLSWDQVPAIHSDTVHVEIALDGKSYSFISGFTDGSIPGPIGESSADRRRRLALQDILQRTAEYVAARYRGGNSK
jgi:hypothetical protein